MMMMAMVMMTTVMVLCAVVEVPGVEGAGFPIQTQSIVNVTIEKMRNFPNPSEKKL